MTNVKRVAAVCAVALALPALLVALGLLGQPTAAVAQSGGGGPQPNMTCVDQGGAPRCYSCAGLQSPTGCGCDGTTSLPAGWVIGTCNPAQQMECTAGQMICGRYMNCANNMPLGSGCATYVVCTGR